MKTCQISNRWVRWMATAGGVLTVSAGAHGGGQPEANLAAQDNRPEGYAGQMARVYAPTDIAITLQPKKAFFKDGGGDLVEALSEVIGNEIILYESGVNVMLELQVTDWSGPEGTTRLKAFGAKLDTGGYTSGLGAALTEKLVPCTEDAECVAAFGGFCSIFGDPCTQSDDCALFPIELCKGSTCEAAPSRLEGFCAPGYAVTSRLDFCLTHTNPLGAVDVSTPAYSYGWVATGGATEAFSDLDTGQKNGKAYLGTLWLYAPDDAVGTYTIDLLPPPDTVLVDQDTLFIPMIGLVPGKITVLDCTGLDCQPNGIPDDCEIQRGLTEDCQPNGIPDECDLGTGASTDCNDNQIPDECEPDCNENGVADSCDIADCLPDTPDCDDCNLNGVPDSCDISSGSSQDDDPVDEIPDECVAPDTTGVDWTDDIWGLADEEYPDNDDSAAGLHVTLTDISLFLDDTVVIQTLRSTPSAIFKVIQTGAGDFTTVAPGGIYSEGTIKVANDRQITVTSGASAVANARRVGTSSDPFTLPPCGRYTADETGGSDGCAESLLCAKLTAGTVTIMGGSTNPCQPGGEMDLTGAMSVEVSSNFLLVGSTNDTCTGEFDYTCSGRTPAARALRGLTPPPKLDVTESASVNVAGNLDMTQFADFNVNGSAKSSTPASATIAGNLNMTESARITVVGSGVVTVGGNLTMTQTADCSIPASAAFRGLTPPPKLDVRETASVSVAGDLNIAQAAETTNDSTVGVSLGGDFDNRSVYPSRFNWLDGRLVLDGQSLQIFEVAGIDLGPCSEGFSTGEDTSCDANPHTNFAIGTLIIQGADGEPPPQVTFTNQSANTVGAGPCDEALYVDTLIFQAGASVTLNNCRVYYNTLEDNGVTPIIRPSDGCGELVPIAPSPPVAEMLAATPLPSPLAGGTVADTTGILVNYKNRFISIATNAADAGRSQVIRVRFVSLPSPFDVWNYANSGQDFFVGEPRKVCENSGKGLETDPNDCPPALPSHTFWAAPLVCVIGEAHYIDWHGWCDNGTCVGGLKPGATCTVDADCVEYVHLYHEGLVPSLDEDHPAQYEIQVVYSTCNNLDEANYSAALTMIQSLWGDVCGPGPGGACSGTSDGTVDVANDVLGVLDKFANVNNLQKARADLEPGDFGQNNGPDFKVNVANDVLFTLSAFTGGVYPFAPGDPCPAE